VQIVGYESAVGGEDDRPRLLLAVEGTVESVWLTPGTELAYSLGQRHCAGTLEWSQTGDVDSHTPCERDATPYCETHTSRWACARCTGECALPLDTCREQHAVYLAAFAPQTFKVGVTRSWRLQTRLREQGADRAAHLHTVENGRIARQIEADIARDVGDRVSVSTKIDGLYQPVSTDQWEQLLAAYEPIATVSFEYGFTLAERPVAETLASGTVRGTQGRVLGTTYAVDLRNLVGYEVTVGGTERALQTSFAAFE
jgi:hypothetical protein